MPCRPPARVDRCPSRRPGVRLLALFAAALIGLPAFSAAQSPAASDTPAPSRDAAPVPAPTPAPFPAPNRDAAGVGSDAPAAAPTPESTEPSRATQPAPVLANGIAIVLVLPLDSAVYGRAAAAVRAGFLAAAQAAATPIRVIAHADGDPLPGFSEARKLGARVVVGPLVRDDLRTLAAAGIDLPTTLALNQLDEGLPLPERVYALSLGIEAEGRQLARLLRAQGTQTVAIVSADVPLQKRFGSAFVGEWILQGGGPPETFRFARAPEELTKLRRDLSRTPIDAVLLAVDGSDVALLKQFVGVTPSYTSSQANDRPQLENQRDLDDLQFVELPWLADPGSPTLEGLPRGNYPNASLERLYALGIDAFRVAKAFVDGPPGKLEIDGATGHLTLGESRVFAREGQLMRLRDGRVEVVAPR
jgi:outer membrane PBP1 activator LpoA protein